MIVDSTAKLPPSGVLRTLALIFVVAVAANLLTLGNPGFFNHDEWQRLDHIQLHGLRSFITQYGAVQAGPDFGYPVRPIGFIQQGLSSLLMEKFPFGAHALDVLIHAVCALALWFCIQSSPLRGRTALVASLVFAVSPLATFSTAWVGASFDRLYVLFALIAATGTLRMVALGFKPMPILLLVIGSVGAILSKETAVMLPCGLVLLMAALLIHDRRRVNFKTAMAVLVIASIPIAVYLAIRLPALQASFGGRAGAYDPAKGSMLENAYLYFAQPFLLPAVELVSASLLPKWTWAAAAVVHLVVLAGLVLRRGLWAGFFYVSGYFLFLLPVMPVSIVGAHYLYGSGIAFSLGLALLLPPPEFARRWLDGLMYLLFAAALGLAVTHSVFIQRNMYDAGKCQMLFLNSLDANLPAARAAGESIIVVPEPGALGYVARRSIFGRHPYAAEHGVAVEVREGEAVELHPGERAYSMDLQCRLVRK